MACKRRKRRRENDVRLLFLMWSESAEGHNYKLRGREKILFPTTSKKGGDANKVLNAEHSSGRRWIVCAKETPDVSRWAKKIKGIV